MSIPELTFAFFTNIVICFAQMIFHLMFSVRFSSFKTLDGAAGYTEKHFSFPVFFVFTI